MHIAAEGRVSDMRTKTRLTQCPRPKYPSCQMLPQPQRNCQTSLNLLHSPRVMFLKVSVSAEVLAQSSEARIQAKAKFDKARKRRMLQIKDVPCV